MCCFVFDGEIQQESEFQRFTDLMRLFNELSKFPCGCHYFVETDFYRSKLEVLDCYFRGRSGLFCFFTPVSSAAHHAGFLCAFDGSFVWRLADVLDFLASCHER